MRHSWSIHGDVAIRNLKIGFSRSVTHERTASPHAAGTMYCIPLAFLVAMTAAGAASAATLTNGGSSTVVVQVADTSGRFDVSLEPGASEDVCPSGCFVTLPNGDRIGLGGQEKVNIKDGAASVE